MPVYGVRATVPAAPQGVKIDVVAPGSRGLNLEQANIVLDAAWATEAQNCVLDSNGRLGARSLLVNQTTSPIGGSPVIRTLFEHRRAAGTVDTIVAWDGGIGNSVTNPSGSSLAGTGTYTSGRWKFVNFNDKCIGFQAGQKPIVRTTGNFATIVETTGTAPQGGVGTAAYGRIWAVGSDGHTIQYSDLLDETKWTGGAAGTIDMQYIWVDGTDVVTAIASFNHTLVVFGKRHVVFFSDNGVAGTLGLDPSKMQVVDIIVGTGCLAQHSVAAIGDSDMFFLSATGVQSLQRLITNRSNPLMQVTKYVRTALQALVAGESDLGAITAVFSPTLNMYLLALPSSGYVWALDTKRRYTDEYGDDCCVVTRWPVTLYSMYETVSRLLYVSRTAGKVAGYGFGPDATEETSIRYIWRSPWQDFATYQVGDRLKLMKRIGGQFLCNPGQQIIVKWWTDFATDDLYSTVTLTSAAGGAASEYGLAEFGIAEFGGGLAQSTLVYDARAAAQYYRFSFEADVSSTFAVQQAQIFAKVGRLSA